MRLNKYRSMSSVAVPFVVAVTMLLVSGFVARFADLKQNKEPLPLKRALSTLSADTLAPYAVVERIVLEPMVVESLGTDQYIDWVLEDRSREPGDPLRMVRLTVTYYTGGSSLVPHTPDVCFLGMGYRAAMPHENIELPVTVEGTGGGGLPARVCTFERTSVHDRARTSVVYTFFVNGEFAALRDRIRLLTNDLRTTHAFFSKVEISFPGATREATIEGAPRLLSRVLPVLIRDHWPDFEAAERAARGSEATTG